jgi:enoyl-CoA hydratase/carnithine racemase
MGHSPLSEILTPVAQRSGLSTTIIPPPPRSPEPDLKATPTPTKKPRPRKVRGTFQISEDLMERARDAAVHLAGPPHRLNLTKLAERAIGEYLEKLESEQNGGKPFPKRDAELQVGRPIGS